VCMVQCVVRGRRNKMPAEERAEEHGGKEVARTPCRPLRPHALISNIASHIASGGTKRAQQCARSTPRGASNAASERHSLQQAAGYSADITRQYAGGRPAQATRGSPGYAPESVPPKQHQPQTLLRNAVREAKRRETKRRRRYVHAQAGSVRRSTPVKAEETVPEVR